MKISFRSIVSIFVLITLLCKLNVKGQELPAMPSSDIIRNFSKDSLKSTEPEIVKAAKWLEIYALNEQETQRFEIIKSIVVWCEKTPNVLFNARLVIFKLFDKNPELMSVYMASYAKWAIENNYSKDELRATLAGIQSVINCYNQKGAKKDKYIEKFNRLMNDGKLEEFLKKNLYE